MNVRPPVTRLVSLALAASLLLTACGAGEESAPAPAPLPSPSPAVTATATSAPSPSPVPSQGPVSGLTGLPLTELPAPRPLAVMINNAPAARPQSGISEADLLYEVLAEGGITRLIGIFQSRSGGPQIGPVRSIRPYLIDIGESYGGVLVHAGGSPAAYALIQSGGKPDMDEIGRAGAYFWREKDRKAPHNLYTNAAKLREGADKLGYAAQVKVPAYTFAAPEDAPPAGGTPAPGFSVRFLLESYNVGYRYNADSRTYVRSMNGKPHLDRSSSAPVEAANVIVLGADHKVLDDVGRLSVGLELGGKALLFQRGQVIEGKWSRRPGDAIRFIRDGKEAALYPGTTHFLIVPNDPAFDSHVTIDGVKSGEGA